MSGLLAAGIAGSPSLELLLSTYGVELLWHPSLSHASMNQHDALLERIVSGEQKLGILCVEDSIITAPRGTGLYGSHKGRARMETALDLARQASAVVAMGTCASLGGVTAASPNPSDCMGL